MAQTLLDDLAVYAASFSGTIGQVMTDGLRKVIQEHSQYIIVELTRKEAGMSLEILRGDKRFESVAAKLEGALRESEVQL